MKYSLSNLHPGKRAFITGAASGLGKAFCEALALDGWTLGVADLNQDGLFEASRNFASLGATTIPYQLDISDRQKYEHVAQDFRIDTEPVATVAFGTDLPARVALTSIIE